MTSEEINEFAKLLVQHVRDSAIKSCDVQLNATNMNSPIAKRWNEAKKSLDTNELGKAIIPDCVDDTIFYLLQAVDNGLLNIIFTMPDGRNVNLSGEIIGELAGWYSGEWIAEYSKERYSDDLDGL